MTSEIDLRARLDAISPSSTVAEKCAMAKLLDTFDSETRAMIEERLFDPNFPYTRLQQELRRAGFKISTGSVGAHRKGNCVCRPGDEA